MMEGCLKITTGNAFDPERPQTALQLFRTDIRIFSLLKHIYWLLQYESTLQATRAEPWPAKTLEGSKNEQINP